MSLSAINIRKSFGKDEILHSVNLSVSKGQITALVGPSGSGKSTLIRALSLIDQPDEGIISFEDNTYKFPLQRGEKIVLPWPKLTVVFQQFFLWPHLTLRKNILLPTRFQKDADAEHINDLIELFEMANFIDRFPNQVSLGQRQRAALVRALVLKPSYILLDEITSALDVEQISKILNHLRNLRDKGIGILVVTHHLKFASNSADKIVFLAGGTVLETGGPDLLGTSANPRIRDFVSMVESTH